MTVVHLGDIFYGTKTICGKPIQGNNVHDIGKPKDEIKEKVTCKECLKQKVMNVSEYIIKHLENIGVTHVFYVSGGQAMYLVDALNKSEKITAVHMMHEHSAVVAAMGYAQYKNELGVVLVTGGPGALNCLNGVAGAYIDSVPLLVISGQDKTFRLKKYHAQRSKGVNEVKILPIVESIIKIALTLYDRKETNWCLETAIKRALTNRKGPVWLEIPLDVQSEEYHD